MKNKKQLHRIFCHVCSRTFDYEAESLSAPFVINDRLVLTCNITDRFPRHSAGEISDSFNRIASCKLGGSK
jgi:hypothetical protein